MSISAPQQKILSVIFNGQGYQVPEISLRNSSQKISELITHSQTFNFPTLDLSVSLASQASFQVFIQAIQRKSFSISYSVYYDLKDIIKKWNVLGLLAFLKKFKEESHKENLYPYKLLFQVKHQKETKETINQLSKHINHGMKSKLFDIIPVPYLELIFQNSKEEINEKYFVHFIQRLYFKKVDPSVLLKYSNNSNNLYLNNQLSLKSQSIHELIEANDQKIKLLSEKLEDNTKQSEDSFVEIKNSFDQKMDELSEKIDKIREQSIKLKPSLSQTDSNTKTLDQQISELSNLIANEENLLKNISRKNNEINLKLKETRESMRIVPQ